MDKAYTRGIRTVVLLPDLVIIVARVFKPLYHSADYRGKGIWEGYVVLIGD
jgi:hypothetical protein